MFIIINFSCCYCYCCFWFRVCFCFCFWFFFFFSPSETELFEIHARYVPVFPIYHCVLFCMASSGTNKHRRARGRRRKTSATWWRNMRGPKQRSARHPPAKTTRTPRSSNFNLSYLPFVLLSPFFSTFYMIIDDFFFFFFTLGKNNAKFQTKLSKNSTLRTCDPTCAYAAQFQSLSCTYKIS